MLRHKLAVIIQGNPNISLLSLAPNLSWVMRMVEMSLSCFTCEMLDLGGAGAGFLTSGAMKWKLSTLYHLTLVVEVLKSAMESWAEPRQSSLLLTSMAQMLTCNVLATSLFLEIAIGKFSPKVGLERSLMALVQNVHITFARAGNNAALIQLKTNK